MQTFLDLCRDLGVPVAMEKTEWATMKIVFLGILLDGENCLLVVPQEKKNKALNWLTKMEGSKKVTKKELENYQDC